MMTVALVPAKLIFLVHHFFQFDFPRTKAKSTEKSTRKTTGRRKNNKWADDVDQPYRRWLARPAVVGFGDSWHVTCLWAASIWCGCTRSSNQSAVVQDQTTSFGSLVSVCKNLQQQEKIYMIFIFILVVVFVVL